MRGLLELSPELAPAAEAVERGLALVVRRFDAQLASDLPPVRALCAHVERYRGKMLRPTLVFLGAMAGRPGASGTPEGASDDLVAAAAVVEMVHMATLVHDDVLDEAETRRRAPTVNRLRGNEAAVILGDYLLASAYHLCSGITRGGNRAALAVARASMVMCAGELLQLHHRDNLSIDERTYFEIVDRKTAELIATACELGAFLGGAGEEACRTLTAFGRDLGVAFQIQDDLLDLMGSEAGVGKSVGKDLEKGKLTLPMVHHLAAADPMTRGRTLRLVQAASGGGPDAGDAARSIREALDGTDSIAHARQVATRLVHEAKERLGTLPESPARGVLMVMTDAVVARGF